MLNRFSKNRNAIESYLEMIDVRPEPKAALDIIIKKKDAHVEFIDIPVYSKQYWEVSGNNKFGIPCFILDNNLEHVECYHSSQVHCA